MNKNELPLTIAQFTIDYDIEAGCLVIIDNQNHLTVQMGFDGIDFTDEESNLLTQMPYDVLMNDA